MSKETQRDDVINSNGKANVKSINLARKVIDNFLASNDETLANELIKWIELKISTLNLTSNHSDRQLSNEYKQDDNSYGQISSNSELSGIHYNTGIHEADSSLCDSESSSKSVNTVQLLNCKCGNSFILRLSISQCMPGTINQFSRDDHSDINDRNDQEDNVADNGHSSETCSNIDDYCPNQTLQNRGNNFQSVNSQQLIIKDYNSHESNFSETDTNNTRYNKRKSIHPVRINNTSSTDNECLASASPETNEKITSNDYAGYLLKPDDLLAYKLINDGNKTSGNYASYTTTQTNICNHFPTNISPRELSRLHEIHNGVVAKGIMQDEHLSPPISINEDNDDKYYVNTNPSYVLMKSKLLTNGTANGINLLNKSATPINNNCSTNITPKQSRSSSSNTNRTHGNDQNQEAHLEYITPEGKRQFRCPVCLNNYANRSGLNRHYITHSPDDLWKAECHICGKKYSRKDSLKHHIKTQHNVMNATDSQRIQSSYRGQSESSCISSNSNCKPNKVPKLETSADNYIRDHSLTVKTEPTNHNSQPHPNGSPNSPQKTASALEQRLEENAELSPTTSLTYYPSTISNAVYSNNGCILSNNCEMLASHLYCQSTRSKTRFEID